jgi:hypothetical protein
MRAVFNVFLAPLGDFQKSDYLFIDNVDHLNASRSGESKRGILFEILRNRNQRECDATTIRTSQISFTRSPETVRTLFDFIPEATGTSTLVPCYFSGLVCLSGPRKLPY